MIVVGVSRFHNASVCLIKDGEVLFHIDNERLSNIKYDLYPFLALAKIKDYVDHVDVVAIAGLGPTVPVECFDDIDVYTTFIRRLGRTFYDADIKVYNFSMEHHLTHAASSFYSSGFSNALCIVKDGMGSEVYLKDKMFVDGTVGRETMSVFEAAYPSKFDRLYQEVAVHFETQPIYLEGGVTVVNNVGEALAFEDTSKTFGFHGLDAGKVMGMSSYGKENKNIPPVYVDGRINKDLFYVGESLRHRELRYDNLDNFQDKADFAYAVQTATQAHVKNQIIEWHEITGINNICLSGGFFLNCVANYEYLKDLPKRIKLHVEPISNDSGTALGAAKLAWHMETKDTTKRPHVDLYYGPSYDYSKVKMTGSSKATPAKIARILADGNIVAMYQGRSEAGPRALGNRSILFDPRRKDGKDVVNTVKGREWFRPFAGTVLEEHARDWFDMRGLESSPYMMYAVDVIDDKKDLIPAITHVDGTCRVQTVNQQQNKNFYDLINEFYKITDVPILFNTSFNLAGDCIVETLDDAISTLQRSKIDYLYLPELGVILKN